MRWPGLTRRVGCCSYLCLAWLYALYATWRFLQGPGSSSMNFAEFWWWTCSNYSRHFVTTPAAGLQSSGSLLALHGIGSHGRSATDLLNVVHEVLTITFVNVQSPITINFWNAEGHFLDMIITIELLAWPMFVLRIASGLTGETSTNFGRNWCLSSGVILYPPILHWYVVARHVFTHENEDLGRTVADCELW